MRVGACVLVNWNNCARARVNEVTRPERIVRVHKTRGEGRAREERGDDAGAGARVGERERGVGVIEETEGSGKGRGIGNERRKSFF